MIDPKRTELTDEEGRELIRYSCFWSLMLLISVPIVCFMSGEPVSALPADLCRILLSPSKLVTDYFELGGCGSAFLNAALCGFACNAVMLLVKAKPSATLLAGYFLVIAHCFYGLNFLNMWIPFLSIPVYCAVMKKPYREHLHLSFFCTSLGPFISDFLFRYTLGSAFDQNHPHFSFAGLAIALAFGLLAGFIVPALLPGTTRMHRGFNLYKAGLAIGLFGMFAFAFFYKTLGIEVPDLLIRMNDIYENNHRSYYEIANLFFGFVFLVTFLMGFEKNGRTMDGYSAVLKTDGLQDDFTLKFGLPLTYMNIGLYGTFVLLYFNVIITLGDGVGFTGPTVGVTIAAITFAANGQHIRNVWPIMLGYMILIGGIALICSLTGLPIPVALSHQGYINGLAFATGLCPFTGRYGIRCGVLAGMLSAVLCTSTSAMHGGFVLYNGGLTAGLTALLLLPILEFYHIPQRPFSERE